MGPRLLCVTGLVWRVMRGFMPGIHGFLHQHFAYPPLEGEGDEPTGAREARPDHRLREPGGVTLRKTTHPSPTALRRVAPLRWSTLPLQGRVSEPGNVN